MSSRTDCPEGRDAVLHDAWIDYLDVDDGEPAYTYEGYVEDGVLNYEHLLRSIDMSLPGALSERESVMEWLARLQAEDERLRPLCGACGQRHLTNPHACEMHPAYTQAPEEGVTVNVRVWVAEHIDNPVQMIRDLLHESDDTPWLSVLETWVDDPE